MKESEVLDIVHSMDVFTKYKYYSDYLFRYMLSKYKNRLNKITIEYPEKSFEEYCKKENLRLADVGDSWKERGFASKEWISFEAASIYHSVYHNLI